MNIPLSRLARRALLAALLAGALAPVAAQAAVTPQVKIDISQGPSNAVVTGADNLQAGPTTFSFKTDKAGDDWALLRLKPGVTYDQVKSTASDPKFANDPSTIENLVILQAGGATPAGRFITTTNLPAGEYVVAILPSNGLPILAKDFPVGNGRNGAKMPKAKQTITLKDFRFHAPKRLRAGQNIRVVNHGPSPHMIVAVKLTKRAKAKTVLRELRKTGNLKKGEFSAFGEIQNTVSGGISNVVLNSLSKGRWALVCFWGDKRSKGMPHAMMGMETIVTVR